MFSVSFVKEKKKKTELNMKKSEDQVYSVYCYKHKHIFKKSVFLTGADPGGGGGGSWGSEPPPPLLGDPQTS